MATLTKTVKRNDLADPIVLEVSYVDDDLVFAPSLATPVVFIMRTADGATLTINREDAEIVSVASGVATLRYQWQAGDTATAGRYRAEFELDLSGKPLTVPTEGSILVIVEADQG